MNKDHNYYIDLLSDYVAQRKSIPCPEIDWSKVLTLSRIHQTEGIVYYQTSSFLPDSFKKVLENNYYATVYEFVNRKKLISDIASALEKSNIDFYMVKGLEIAKYYPNPALRTMGDCDIIVSRTDFPETVNVLRNRGFRGSDTISSEQWGCDKNQLHFEIHDRLVQEGEFATNQQASFFNNYTSYVNHGILDPNFHFMFLLMHLRKHFLNHGVGIRQFMDLAVMSQYADLQLKWEWIESKLKEIGLQKFSHTCYALIENWFGISIPIQHESLSDEDINQITEKILKNGVFGLDDVANQNANAHTALLKAKGPMWMRRLIVLYQNVFLSYEIMRGYSECEFVDGKPWLLPFAWGKRLIGILRRKDKSNTIGVIKNSFIRESELDDRRELLNKMGLL